MKRLLWVLAAFAFLVVGAHYVTPQGFTSTPINVVSVDPAASATCYPGNATFSTASGRLAVCNTTGTGWVYIGAGSTGAFFVPPGACTFNVTGTAGTNNNLIIPTGASFTPALLASTTAAGASNDTLTCMVLPPTDLTAGRGITVNDVVVFYGVQTTALTSLGAPTLGTITFPAAGTAETPSAVAPVTAGAVTVTPVVGSANLGLTTAGAFFSEKVALNTPVTFTTDLQYLYFAQIFAQSAAAAQIVNVPGLVVHYSRNF